MDGAVRLERPLFGDRRRAMGYSALIGVALAGIALLLPLIPFPLETTATLGMAGTLVAFLLLRARQGRLDWFEIAIPVGVLYLVYFGVGALHMKANPGRLFGRSLDNYVTPALGVAVVAFVAMVLGYASMFRRTRPSPALAIEPRGAAGILWLGALGVCGTGATILQVHLVYSGARFSTVLNALDQFSPLFLLAWALAWYMFWSQRLDARGKMALFAVLAPAAAVIVALTVGGKQRVILILLLPLVARWYARRSMPWLAIGALVLLTVFVVFPLYNTFRFEDRHLGSVERLDRAVTSASRWSKDEFLENSSTAFLDRMAIVSSIAALLRDVPDVVDYRYGSTLTLAPVSLLIPRFLWPDKPNIALGREFGETFGLVHTWDQETSIAPSVVGDFYWNFALPGVVAGMFLFGGAMRWYYQRYGAARGYDPMRKAVYMALFSIITHFEGNVALLVAVTAKTIAIVLVMTYVLRRLGVFRELSAPAPVAPAVR